MPEVDLTRRRLLIGAAGLLGALAAGPSVLVPLIERLAAADAAALLRGLIRHREGAIQLGRSYLSAHPSEASRAALVRQLAGPIAPASSERAARGVGTRIREDYAIGHTVVVEGWVLSRTEARLYALVALG
jgi:hypothetical protein